MYKEESAQSNQGAQGRTHGNILSIRKVNIDKNTLGVDSKKGALGRSFNLHILLQNT